MSGDRTINIVMAVVVIVLIWLGYKGYDGFRQKPFKEKEFMGMMYDTSFDNDGSMSTSGNLYYVQMYNDKGKTIYWQVERDELGKYELGDILVKKAGHRYPAVIRNTQQIKDDAFTDMEDLEITTEIAAYIKMNEGSIKALKEEDSPSPAAPAVAVAAPAAPVVPAAPAVPVAAVTPAAPGAPASALVAPATAVMTPNSTMTDAQKTQMEQQVTAFLAEANNLFATNPQVALAKAQQALELRRQAYGDQHPLVDELKQKIVTVKKSMGQ